MSEDNPWKTKDSRVVYENPWIRVREDQVIRPDGQPGIYGVVETRIATGVVAINEREEVYLVGQYRYTLEQYSWEIIEGGAEPGEKPLDAIKRELKEEAGLTANKWVQLGAELHLSNCHSSEVAYLYLAEEISIGEASPEETEELQIQIQPLTRAVQMVHSGEIKDAMSVIGILRAEKYLEQRKSW